MLSAKKRESRQAAAVSAAPKEAKYKNEPLSGETLASLRRYPNAHHPEFQAILDRDPDFAEIEAGIMQRNNRCQHITELLQRESFAFRNLDDAYGFLHAHGWTPDDVNKTSVDDLMKALHRIVKHESTQKRSDMPVSTGDEDSAQFESQLKEHKQKIARKKLKRLDKTKRRYRQALFALGNPEASAREVCEVLGQDFILPYDNGGKPTASPAMKQAKRNIDSDVSKVKALMLLAGELW